MGNTDPAGKFIVRLLVIVASGVFMLLVHAVSVLKFHGGNFKRQQPSLTASVGTVFYCFFLSVVASVLSAFNCVPHPNGSATLWSYPSLLCWEGGQHDVLITLSCAA